MGREDRRGVKKNRNELSIRAPELGYYIVVTDTEQTEKNYIEGIKNSIPHNLRDRLVIKTDKSTTNKLVDFCIEHMSLEPQFRIPWIIFDRDRVPDFDEIIKRSASVTGVSSAITIEYLTLMK